RSVPRWTPISPATATAGSSPSRTSCPRRRSTRASIRGPDAQVDEPMARRHPVLRAFLLFALGTAGLLALIAGVAILSGGLGGPFLGRTVGVVELHGVIEDATDVVDTLERFRQADGTVAVVLRIDSPGGAVAPAQEIYDEVWRVRERKPVVASLGTV